MVDAQLQALLAAIKSDSTIGVRAAINAKPELLSAPCDALGRTPLHLAAAANRSGIAEMLIKAGADFYAFDANGQMPLDVPPGETLNAARQYLRTLNVHHNVFLEAVHKQQIETVRTMMEKDHSLVNALDIDNGWSPLMIACFHGNAEMVRMLINSGARMEDTDFHTGLDAAYFCAERGSGECMALLIRAGVDPSHTRRVIYGRLPMMMNALHVACWKGKTDVVAVLLQAGVDANARAKSYALFSPLHFAATEGHTEIVKLLLAHNADPTARDGRRAITAIEMAELSKHPETAAVLRSEPERDNFVAQPSPYRGPTG